MYYPVVFVKNIFAEQQFYAGIRILSGYVAPAGSVIFMREWVKCLSEQIWR